MIRPNIFKIGSPVKIQNCENMSHLKKIIFQVVNVCGEVHTLLVLSNENFNTIHKDKYSRVVIHFKKDELIGATYKVLGRFLDATQTVPPVN